MLLELRIRDLAVIRDLSLRLAPGLNVLTGETGAGKSILVGALSLLLGERASSDTVRVGADRALIEAVFDVTGQGTLQARLDAEGVPDEAGLLILRREVQREGRNRAWINGSPVTAGVLGAIGRELVDLHGQHDHQTLLRLEEQRAILDAFSDAEGVLAEVAGRHAALIEARKEREESEARAEELARRADYLRFQLSEIATVAPTAGEDERLEEELALADHAEELAREGVAVHDALYDADGSCTELLADARDRLHRLAAIDPTLSSLADEIEDAYHRVTDIARRAGNYASNIDINPARAEEIRDRLDALHRLRRKFGPELSGVLQAAAGFVAELEELDGLDQARAELDLTADEAESALADAAGELSGLRRAGADRLASEVEALLPELGMPDGRFLVALEPLDSIAAGGAERVRFMATLNSGFAPAELAKIASGGELSRVMLALKAVLAREDRVPTLVFDEVDAGIGGAVAVTVGHKLAEVARHHQVFVITHLPQVAALAGEHFRVDKGVEEGVATTHLTPLRGDDRVSEIARMLDGDAESETSRKHAEEMLGISAA